MLRHADNTFIIKLLVSYSNRAVNFHRTLLLICKVLKYCFLGQDFLIHLSAVCMWWGPGEVEGHLGTQASTVLRRYTQACNALCLQNLQTHHTQLHTHKHMHAKTHTQTQLTITNRLWFTKFSIHCFFSLQPRIKINNTDSLECVHQWRLRPITHIVKQDMLFNGSR